MLGFCVFGFVRAFVCFASDLCFAFVILVLGCGLITFCVLGCCGGFWLLFWWFLLLGVYFGDCAGWLLGFLVVVVWAFCCLVVLGIRSGCSGWVYV